MEELREEISETTIETADENRDNDGGMTEEKSMGGGIGYRCLFFSRRCGCAVAYNQWLAAEALNRKTQKKRFYGL